MKINLKIPSKWGTVNDSTGAAADADSTPTVTVYKMARPLPAAQP